MFRTIPHAFRLTPEIVAAHGGEQVLCLAGAGVGRRWDLYPTRPGAEYVTALDADGYYGITGPALEPVKPIPAVMRVDIRGPIEETAGCHDPCSAWTDGNDAIAERLCAAFDVGDVLLCIHSPGGNPSGAPEAMRRALESKAANGRRCLVHCEGMAASLALWWAAVLGDEFYCSPDARIGSIGARGAHGSVAGALAIEGVVVTYSAWPDDGKIALAPELPLSAVGKARNDRDVAIIGEAFAAAVAGSLGSRTGLTVDMIRSMPGAIGGADVLTGAAALAAGLVDGLATLEDTAAWALESAGTGTGETMTMRTGEGGDKPPEKDDKDPESGKGAQPSGVCKGCGMGNRPEAKFCDQCGGTMAAPPMDPDKDPESGKPAPKGARHVAPVHTGLASIPALRSGLSRAEGLLSSVASMLCVRSHAEITGALEATIADAGNAKRYRAERNTERARADQRERMDLLSSLSASDPVGHPRRKLVKDVVEDVKTDGKVTGSRVVGLIPTAQWGDGPEGRSLPNLRAYTRTTLAGLTANSTTERSPYDRAPAETSETAAQERVTAAHVEAAKGAPAVKQAVEDGVDPKVAAEVYTRRFGPAAQGATP